MKLSTLLLVGAAALMTLAPAFGQTQPKMGKKKTSFTIATSIYPGWMPWYYANETGILKKWADKHGIKIIVKYGDYIPTVEMYAGGAVDACTMTNMEALDMPAAGGIDTTMMIVGDFSNGGDRLLTRGITKVGDLKGETIGLVEGSVSHYLLARALAANGMRERDVKVKNVSDSDIGALFITSERQKAIVTWNPIAMDVMAQVKGCHSLFDSSMIPGEILDCLAVNSATLRANPKFGKALASAWYEVMGKMTKRGKASKEVKEMMAKSAGTKLRPFEAQLKATAMFYKASDAAAYAASDELRKNMDNVRKFCFEHGLLGEGIDSVDAIGISYPGGAVQGNKKNIKLRFDNSYMKAAASSDSDK